MRALIAILLGGCADDDPSDSESSGSPGGDSGASWFDASAPAAEYSFAEVEAAITQAPQDSVLVPLDTFVWISSVVDRFSVEGNPACPAWLASESNPSASYSNWLGTCDAGDELLRGSW